jgi:hypothetical protein
MSGELTEHEIHRLLVELDNGTKNALEVAELTADKLRGHITWQAEQIAERDRQIESLQQDLAAALSLEDR